MLVKTIKKEEYRLHRKEKDGETRDDKSPKKRDKRPIIFLKVFALDLLARSTPGRQTDRSRQRWIGVQAYLR
ncbi:hypothetical protein BgiBS90_012943 [Biomphalaria glabrata]|nr:hypothetical protein BgiBS90_012943 [Biomphalaria glabrata]